METKTNPNPTSNKSPDSFNPISDNNKLVLHLQTPPLTKEQEKEQLISARKAVMEEMSQAIVDYINRRDDEMESLKRITKKAVDDGIYKERQMRGITELVGDSFEIEIKAGWYTESKVVFDKELNKYINETRDAFMAGDILITPATIMEGEMEDDQTPDYEPAYKRGVTNGYGNLEMEYSSNILKINEAIDEEIRNFRNEDEIEDLNNQRELELDTLSKKNTKDRAELFYKATIDFGIFKAKDLKKLIIETNEDRKVKIHHKPIITIRDKGD